MSFSKLNERPLRHLGCQQQPPGALSSPPAWGWMWPDNGVAWQKGEDGAWGYVAGSGGGSDGAVPCSGWEGVRGQR